jgi:hypothetical protein
MSLTQGDQVFAEIHETALNDVLHAFFKARPRYRAYGSPGLVPATTVNATQMPALPLPGGGSVDWAVQFEVPEIDLFDQDKPLPPGVTLGAGQFSLSTKITICIICGGRRPSTDPKENGQAGSGRLLCTQLGVFGIGHIESWHDANGNGEVWLRVDQVELIDITPDSLESLLECLIRLMLDTALSTIRIPIKALRAGAFQLVVTRGPDIDDDHVKAFGHV